MKNRSTTPKAGRAAFLPPLLLVAAIILLAVLWLASRNVVAEVVAALGLTLFLLGACAQIALSVDLAHTARPTQPSAVAWNTEVVRRVPLPLRMRLPLPSVLWPTIMIVDASSLPGYPRGGAVRIERDVRVRAVSNSAPTPTHAAARAVWAPTPVAAAREGIFTLGPTYALVTDWLGLFTRTLPLCPTPQTLVVAPRCEPLRHCVLGHEGQIAGALRARQAQERPPDIDTVRPYRSGDRMTTIAWRPSVRSVLRGGDLVSKQFVRAVQQQIWLLVDHDGAQFAPTGSPLTLAAITSEESTLLKVVALSVAAYHLARRAEVGLVVSGATDRVLAPATGDRQRNALDDALARASTGMQALERQVRERALVLDALAALRLTAVEPDSAANDEAESAGSVQLDDEHGLTCERGTTSLDRLLLSGEARIQRGQICILVTPHPPQLRTRTIVQLRRLGAQVHVAAIGRSSTAWRPQQARLRLPSAYASPDWRADLIAALEGASLGTSEANERATAAAAR